MDVLISDLHAVFSVLQSGVIPDMSAEELAISISSVVNHSLNTLIQSTPSVTSKDTDLFCLCLTVIGKVIASQSSKSFEQNVKDFYEYVIKRLFADSSLMQELVHFLKYQDRFLFHLTAKCMSSFVIYDININRDSNPVWTAMLVETFKESGPGYKLDTCLWSLTRVIKGILRGHGLSKQDD
ncbi:protein Lines homolog 1 [Brachyhypopomus gauderio]|uniref:protein Lines homolog 1 n=1 Tax=Brachyhypopomus gauderio TaxID=698409 RepID=UPI0040415C1E